MKVLILQHTDGEHPAAFGDLIAEAGDTAFVVELHLGERIPDMSEFDAMIVMGGPMDVWQTAEHPWLRAEKAAIATWVRAFRKPYLGICLGHQLLIDALGGLCEQMTPPEIGVLDVSLTAEATADPIFDGFEDTFRVMHWHGVEVTSLPEDTVVLAENANCNVQAVRFRDKAWGVQFHPELTPELVTGWLGDPGNYACAVEWLGSEEKAKQFALDCEAHVSTAQQQSRRLYAGLRAAVTRSAATLTD